LIDDAPSTIDFQSLVRTTQRMRKSFTHHVFPCLVMSQPGVAFGVSVVCVVSTVVALRMGTASFEYAPTHRLARVTCTVRGTGDETSDAWTVVVVVGVVIGASVTGASEVDRSQVTSNRSPPSSLDAHAYVQMPSTTWQFQPRLKFIVLRT